MTDDLIIVGASVRAAAFSAMRAGFKPYAVDQFADRDLTDACAATRIDRYPDDFAAALRDAPDAPWIYTGGLENYPRLVDQMAEVRPLWGNTGSVLRRVRNPFLLEKASRAVGFGFPSTVRNLPADRNGDPSALWLKKPLHSSGGSRIRLAPSGSQARCRGYYYQQYVPGRAWGAVFLATGANCSFLGASQQRMNAIGQFAYQGSLVAAGSWHHDVRQLCTLGTALTDRFGLRGLFNVDFVSDERGDWVLEVNPRYSASVELLERATGLDYLSLHAAAFGGALRRGTIPKAIAQPSQAYGKAIVYAARDGCIPQAFDELAAQWNAGGCWPRAFSRGRQIADLPRVGDRFRAGQPLCTVFADAATPYEVERILSDRIDRIGQVVTGDESAHPRVSSSA